MLNSFSVAIIAAASADERHYSTNNNDFLDQDAAWFTSWSPKNMMSNLKIATPLVNDAYFADKPRVAERFNKFWTSLQNQMGRQANKCLDINVPAKEVDVPDKPERSNNIFQSHQLNGNANDDFWAIFWGHAVYIREALLQNENCNQRLAMRLLRRVDRLRYFTEWQYCDKVDIEYSNCKWIHKWNWNAPALGGVKGEERGNPRTWQDFQEGGKYNPDFEA